MATKAPWQARFGAFSVSAFDLARDRPGRAVVAAARLDPHQLWAWDRDTGDLRQLTSARSGILSGFISADGGWVYYLDDPEASEEGVLVRVPWAGGTAEVVDPALGRGFLWNLVAHGSGVAFTFVIDGRFEHRVALNDQSGSRAVVTDEASAFIGALVDDGRTLMTARWLDDGNRESVLYDVATGSQVAALSEPGVTLLAYTPSPIRGDSRMLAESSGTGVRRPLLWDRSTGARMPIPVDDLAGDVRPVAWSPDGATILLLQIHQADTRFHRYDLATGDVRPLDTPAGAVTALPNDFATLYTGSSEILTLWQDGAYPPAIRSIPLDGTPSSVALGDPQPPPGHQWRSVSFPSADGTPIQAWLAAPDGDGPFPALVDIHGGPNLAQFEWFNPQLQAFVDQGYAVITVNYRGSATFGTAFEESIVGRPGELEVEDVVAAADYLVGAGIADPRRIVVEGWSYGGYLTLMALSRRPDVWAGGICGVGIADMTGMVEEATEFIVQMITQLHGGPPSEVPERYRESSPITHAAGLSAPLLVIHGRNDIRCPAGQMERYLARLDELGKDVSVEWFSAGHSGGVADPVLDMAHTELMLAFAAGAIGDRDEAPAA